MTRKKAAAILNVDPCTIEGLISDGTLKGTVLPRRPKQRLFLVEAKSVEDHRSRCCGSLSLKDASQILGLTQANALGVGGQNLGSQAQTIQSQLNALIDDMSRDKDVIQGNGLVAFQRAKNELVGRFGELMQWINSHGIHLSDAQTGVNSTDQQSGDDLSSASSGLSALVASPNR